MMIMKRIICIIVSKYLFQKDLRVEKKERIGCSFIQQKRRNK